MPSPLNSPSLGNLRVQSHGPAGPLGALRSKPLASSSGETKAQRAPLGQGAGKCVWPVSPGQVGSRYGAQPQRGGEWPPRPPPPTPEPSLCSLASPVSAGSTQVALQSAHPVAQLTALLLPWGQRLGCRADIGQASLVGVGLREGAIIPAFHSFVPHLPSPQRGPGRARGNRQLCPTGRGMLRKGPGVWVGAATS